MEIFTAKIDGSAFTGDKNVGATKALNVIVIGAQSNDGGQIVLRVADSGVHKYTFDHKQFFECRGSILLASDYSYTTNQGNNASESGGTVSITSIDTTNKKMSGTFSMKVYRQLDATQKEITEGTFTNVSYETTCIATRKCHRYFSRKGRWNSSFPFHQSPEFRLLI